jgi:hypothetical protein
VLQEGKSNGGKGSGAARKGGKNNKRYGAPGASTDEQLMGRLGEILGGNMKVRPRVHSCRGAGDGQAPGRAPHPSQLAHSRTVPLP